MSIIAHMNLLHAIEFVILFFHHGGILVGWVVVLPWILFFLIKRICGVLLVRKCFERVLVRLGGVDESSSTKVPFGFPSFATQSQLATCGWTLPKDLLCRAMRSRDLCIVRRWDDSLAMFSSLANAAWGNR